MTTILVHQLILFTFLLWDDEEEVAFLFDGGDGEGGVGEQAADVGDLDVEGERVGVACVTPDLFEDAVAFDGTAEVLG